ncbi:uncharacterized protein BX663DRAFT_504113 [Cokeromyces recurvatus]|uniref:uncharacterized protein n=1 Tax=Cokeromyces recurvatus TaxID=90255 RepID=UPI00221F807F|nr:uncharacterized protein BX663DRAFT_504113 [Cokeromyces recurvatus]KAI7904150.1 hypothetical protein BX663DRAFT_504113 [Cokeromyces recurvatus]
MIERRVNSLRWSRTLGRIQNNNSPYNTLSDTHPSDNWKQSWPAQQGELNAVPRTRNNSLIPVELMMNNSGEGGRECVALATIFGVPEYI